MEDHPPPLRAPTRRDGLGGDREETKAGEGEAGAHDDTDTPPRGFARGFIFVYLLVAPPPSEGRG